MASLWSEETFVCSVCLEMLQDPATLPCGHTYCLPCIDRHWDTGSTKDQYSCPQCRQIFKPRPSLARSTVLVEAMEKLRAKSSQESPNLFLSSDPPSMPIYLEVSPHTGPHQGGMYPQLPAFSPGPCSQHRRPLELYCYDDMKCVCDECCRHEHDGHRVVKPEKERREKQRALIQMQAEIQQKILENERKLKELPQDARLHNGSSQALQREAVELFAELVKSVELMGTQVSELICAQEASMGSRVEAHIHRLEQEGAQLRRKDEELNRLASMQDNICFLKSFHTLEPPIQNEGREWGGLGDEAVLSGVRTVMVDLRDALQDLCKSSLAKMFRAVNDATLVSLPSGQAVSEGGAAAAQNEGITALSEMAPEVPPNPRLNTVDKMRLPPPHQPQVNPVTTVDLANQEPKTREEMLKFRFQPKLDPNTAYRHLRLSDGDCKATLRAENQNHPDHPDRFLYWRQILCREPLAGSPYYWETEWTGQKITIGVALREMDRKGSDDVSRLGHNEQSWGLYWSGTGYSMWHSGKETQLGSPKARRVGVYLDQHEGVLAFYRVCNDQAHLIYSTQTQFAGPLYPGFRFWTGVGATVTLCQMD